MSSLEILGFYRKEAGDVERAGETVEAVQKQIDDLNAAFKADVDRLQSKVDAATEPLETVTVRPKKTNITVRLVALGWNKL